MNHRIFWLAALGILGSLVPGVGESQTGIDFRQSVAKTTPAIVAQKTAPPGPLPMFTKALSVPVVRLECLEANPYTRLEAATAV